MNKISEYPAQIYMQSENRKKLIESIFNLKNLHIISLWTEKLTKSLKTLFSSFRKVVLTKKQDRQTSWLTDRQNERKKEYAHIPYAPQLLDSATHNEIGRLPIKNIKYIKKKSSH